MAGADRRGVHGWRHRGRTVLDRDRGAAAAVAAWRRYAPCPDPPNDDVELLSLDDVRRQIDRQQAGEAVTRPGRDRNVRDALDGRAADRVRVCRRQHLRRRRSVTRSARISAAFAPGQ